MATTTHWLPKSSAHSEMMCGCCTATVFTETLSAPALRALRMSSLDAYAAAHRQWDEQAFRGPLHHMQQRLACVRARR